MTDCPLHLGQLTTEIISRTTTLCPVTGTAVPESSVVKVGSEGTEGSESGGGSETARGGMNTSITWMIRTVYETKIVSTVTRTLPGSRSSGVPPAITPMPASGQNVSGTPPANQTSIGGFQQVSAAMGRGNWISGTVFWAAVVGILGGLWLGTGFLL